MDSSYIQRIINLLQTLPEGSVSAIVVKTPMDQVCVMGSSLEMKPDEICDLLDDGIDAVNPESADEEEETTKLVPSIDIDRTPKH